MERDREAARAAEGEAGPSCDAPLRAVPVGCQQPTHPPSNSPPGKAPLWESRCRDQEVVSEDRERMGLRDWVPGLLYSVGGVEGVSLLQAHGLCGETGVQQPGLLALVGRGQRDSSRGRFLGLV